jgi:hypothetical protein
MVSALFLLSYMSLIHLGIFLDAPLGQIGSRALHSKNVVRAPHMIHAHNAAKKATQQSIQNSVAQEMVKATQVQRAGERTLSPMVGMFKEARDMKFPEA